MGSSLRVRMQSGGVSTAVKRAKMKTADINCDTSSSKTKALILLLHFVDKYEDFSGYKF